MAIKVKARETLIKVGPYQNTYRFVLNAELYSMLSSSKVIAEAALRSGLSKGVMNAAWEAIINRLDAACCCTHQRVADTGHVLSL